MKRILPLFLLLLIGLPLAAQPQLELRLLKRNVPAYYYYQLFISTSCGDSIIYDLNKNQLILEERFGRIDVNDYTIDRFASPTRNSCYDLALIFDNSSTMSPASLSLAKTAGIVFIDSMAQVCQSAAIVSFTDRPTLRSFLTNDHAALHSALEGMAPSGKRALYDAIYTGLLELTTNGTQRVRVVLVLTTGGDNASGTDFQELIDRALYDDTRIFMIGLGADVPAQFLKNICTETGGLYFPVSNADELPALYGRLAGFIQREFDEHRIIRRTKDVEMKDLLVRLRLEACEDSIWVSRLFYPTPVTGIEPAAPPASFTLGQSWPNPVSVSSPEIHFHFSVSNAQSLPLRLQIFDNLGRLLHTVFEREYAPGSHTFSWNPPLMKPGMYIYRLSRGNIITHGRMIIVP